LNRHNPLAIASALVLFLAFACAPDYVEGLSLSEFDGTAVDVSRARGEGSVVPADSVAVFSPERPISFGAEQDLAILVRGSGRLTVRLFASTRSGSPVASADFAVIAGLDAELRIPVPSGASVSVIEIGSVAGSDAPGGAELSGFAVRPAFWGFRFDGDGYIVDATTTLKADSVATYARLEVPRGLDASLIVGAVADGTVRITPLGSGGARERAFVATLRAGTDLALPLAALDGAAAVSIESAAGLRSASYLRGEGAPLSDLHAILAIALPVPVAPAVYRWDILPGTLVFDFADYAAQDRYLKRLAFFAEKPGFRGRLASDGEIEKLHGWNAHDYSAGTMAAFFAKAEAEKFPLNRSEEELLETLVSYGVLTRDSGGIGAGTGAIISISRESSPELRRLFLDHEASHALFFQDAEYRRLSERLWDSLGPEARRFWLTHLSWRRYDTKDRYLCVNEHQSYLVQQATRYTRTYYESVLARLIEAYPMEQARLEADAPLILESTSRCADELDSYLASRWGLSAGRFGRLRRP
jgi:hypothetical protein